MIVKKFRPAIPERRLVLVPFENKFVAIFKPVTLPEIFGHAANEKIRLAPRNMKNPRKHRRCRGLAMSAAHYDRMLSRQKLFFQHFRQRSIRNLAIEHFLKFRIPARDDVPDHNQIRLRIEMLRIKTVKERNPHALEKRRGRRIHSRIRAGNAPAFLSQHSGQRRPPPPADSNYLNVIPFCHGVTAPSRISSVPAPLALSRARAPSGTVNIGRTVCPTGAPNTIGIPSGFRIRSQTSSTVGLPSTGAAQSGKSPTTIPRTSLNLPACCK